LDIDMSYFDKSKLDTERNILKTNSILHKIFNLFFIVLLNLVIVSVFGYLTIDSFANVNSNVGALILSFFLAYFITSKTTQITGVERLLKYGAGVLVYGF